MNVFGNLDFQNNTLSNVAFAIDDDFPQVASEGRIVFHAGILYICVLVSGQPSWIPLTQELKTLVYTNSIPSAEWTINHNYHTTSLMVQVYDADQKAILVDEIEQTDIDNIVFRFASPVAGKAVIICKRV